MLSQVKAQLLTLFFQPLFYGIYLVTFGFTLKSLLHHDYTTRSAQFQSKRWRSRSEISWGQLTIAILMALIATLDVSLSFFSAWKAFGGDVTVGKSLEDALASKSGWTSIIGSVDVILMTILGDIMLIYRCFIIHGKSWIMVAAPIFLALSGLALVVASIFMQTKLPPGGQFESPYKEIQIATWSMTIAINVVTTGLIVWRIQKGRRNAAVNGVSSAGTSSSGTTIVPHKSALRHAVRVIIESGLLYTVIATATALAYIANNNIYSPLSGIDIDVIGIAFNLIVIRVDRRRDLEQQEFNRPPQASALVFSPDTFKNTIASTSSTSNGHLQVHRHTLEATGSTIVNDLDEGDTGISPTDTEETIDKNWLDERRIV